MKKLSMICMAALLLLAASCKKEKKIELGDGIGFRATTEAHGGNGKTHLDGLKVIWDMDDEILVYSSNGGGGKYGTPETFKATEVDGSTAGFSSGSTIEEAFYTAPYKAYYPASGIVDASKTDQITLPATQTYAANSFARGANPMVAIAEDTELAFKNICGVLQLSLKSTTTCKVTSIAVTTKGDENLWGTGTVGLADPDEPTLSALADGGKTVTLNCSKADGGGVDISSEKVFRIVVPAGSLGSSFEVKLTDSNGKVWKQTATSTQNVIERNTITILTADGISTHTPVTPSSVTITAGCIDCTYSVSGTVKVPSGTYTCEYGLVYSETDATPTIEEGASKLVVNTESISGTKNFTADITKLTEDVKYYVRAYAMIDGTAYSSESTVQTVTYSTPKDLPTDWTNGKSPKKFTVADPTPENPNSGDETKVYFSQGNLQYMGSAAAPYWKFADHQFDFLGNNGQGSDSETADRDLFGWGTSSWNNGNHFYQPYDTDKSTYTPSVGYGYGPTNGTSYSFSLTGDFANADWGVYNAISNGGNQAGKWRTLTNDEWVYLLNTRTDGSGNLLYGEGKVGGCTSGLIILPDDWKWEGDVAGFKASWKPGDTDWSNVYSYSDWAKMEAAGGVYLPAAGKRNGTSVVEAGSVGYYWSSSYGNSGDAYYLFFNSGNVYPSYYGGRYYGRSVRLVSEN